MDSPIEFAQNSSLNPSALPFVPSASGAIADMNQTALDDAEEEWIEVKRPERRVKLSQELQQTDQREAHSSEPRRLLNETGQLPPSSNQLDFAIESIQAGRKVLILMRGCPGSGKSTLAR